MLNVMRLIKTVGAFALVPTLLALAGCGGSNDKSELISIEVSGGLAGTNHKIVVQDDGSASCDGRSSTKLSSKKKKEAEGLTDEIKPLAKKDASYGDTPTPDARSYTIRTDEGTVKWFDGDTVPAVLDRTVRFADSLQALIC